MREILIFLDGKMPTPTDYGWFHLLCLLMLIVIIYLLCKRYKKPSIKDTKRLFLILSLICVFLEIYKQINFSFNYNLTTQWWSYQWYAFPFQFCSVPMYVGLVAALTKNQKLEKYLFSFLATYGLIAGISVMLYPNNVYVSTIGINIQTMVHHGIMVIMGMFLLIKGIVKPTKKTFIQALITFSIILTIALTLNIVTYYIGIDGGLSLFYISPFHQSILPVFSEIYTKVPYIIFLLIYILIFSLGSILILLITKLMKRKETRI